MGLYTHTTAKCGPDLFYPQIRWQTSVFSMKAYKKNYIESEIFISRLGHFHDIKLDK